MLRITLIYTCKEPMVFGTQSAEQITATLGFHQLGGVSTWSHCPMRHGGHVLTPAESSIHSHSVCSILCPSPPLLTSFLFIFLICMDKKAKVCKGQ